MKWFKSDLHLHTPASADYEQPGVSYLQWLQAAEAKGLDIVAVTDHNTVAGVATMRREIEWLARLENEDRLTDGERQKLTEWRRLADMILVLPGFEFTATFGFHILGIFPPDTSVRQLEHILLTLNVPAHLLDAGSTETGAGTDVLTAYKVIREAGGIPIAAHANSTHGVAMRNFPFGGQTKIAYTQNANLLALEVTDLDSRSYRATRRFFNGSKPEYARRMHCLQGSDAHRLTQDPKNAKRLGVGDRVTELAMAEPSFEELRALLVSDSFDRVRGYRQKESPVDELEVARNEGASIVQSFHESASLRGGRLTAIVADICAFANTSGGTVWVGASSRKGRPKGFQKPQVVLKSIQDFLMERITPPLDVKIDTLQVDGIHILRISVPKGKEKPYCLEGYKVYVRNEADTDLAVRDEIVSLVQESLIASGNGSQALAASKAHKPVSTPPTPEETLKEGERTDKGSRRRRASRRRRSSGHSEVAAPESEPLSGSIASDDSFYLPQVGVEIVDVSERSGTNYYQIRDLRNGRIVQNVTRRSARKLWDYAISQHEDKPVVPAKVEWAGKVGLIEHQVRAGKTRYDLALREDGKIRVFYGVTADGMEGSWAALVRAEE